MLPETTQLLLQHQQRLDDAERRYRDYHQYMDHLPTTQLMDRMRNLLDGLRSNGTRDAQQTAVNEGQLQLGSD